MVTSHSNDGAVHLSLDTPPRHDPLDGFPEPPAWMGDAVCATTDPEAFYPEKGGSTREAKAICRSCTVQAECLDWALDRDERFGIWGGLSERERHKLKPRALCPVCGAEPDRNHIYCRDHRPTRKAGHRSHHPQPAGARMTTTEITDETRLTMLKHLASGKDLDTVATIVGKPRPLVLDVVSKHGYPNSLDKGIELLAAKIDKDRNTIPPGRPLPTSADASTPAPAAPRPATTSPSSVTNPDARPVGAPDEIRVLLNTGKNHTSKRIQTAADRVFDAIGHLRDLLAEDQEKHAAKRAEEAAKATARAEVQRLEKALADAKAKLRGGSKPVATTLDVSSDVSSAELRAWAKSKGIAVPDRGPIPTDVRQQYAAEHPDEAA